MPRDEPPTRRRGRLVGVSALLLLPVVASFLLLAAHFLRAGVLPLVILSLAVPLVLLVRRPWAARVVQVCLLLAAVEWLATMYLEIQSRQRFAEPWARYAAILGSVIVFTVASAWAFHLPPLRRRYFGASRAADGGRRGDVAESER